MSSSAFWARAGVAAIFFTTLLHPDYHTPADNPDTTESYSLDVHDPAHPTVLGRNEAIASLNASALMIFRNPARQMPSTISSRPCGVTGKAPFVRLLHALIAADAGSWM